MNLHPLEGHEADRTAVAGAFARGRLPQALLLHGPPGVGKQRFALWVGQLLLCEAPDSGGPCGACRGCRLALKVEHPDLHWYFPVKKPPSRGSPERNDEALEDARRERLGERRETPLGPTHVTEARGLHLGTVRNLRRRAASRPSMARRQVFVIAEAEELVSQEASPEAANALLKVLEEPPEGTWFVLTSGEPGRLLPTIRSRTSSLHLAALPEERVAAFLVREGGAPEEEAEKAARLASGSIGRALGFLPEGEEPGPLEALRREAFHLLRAGLAPDPAERYARALAYGPTGARGLQELLVSLEAWLRDVGAAAAGATGALLNRDAEEWLAKTVRARDIHPLGAARAVTLVEEARAQAAGNVNPQLLLAGLLVGLNRTLVPPAGGRRTE
jgi:DNA polymerase III subunit delta'